MRQKHGRKLKYPCKHYGTFDDLFQINCSMSQCPRVVFAWSPCQPCPVTLCILIQILGIRQAIWSVRAMVCIVGSLWLWNEDRVAWGSSWDNLYWMTTMGNKMKEKELYGLFHLVSLNKGSQNKKASPQSGLIFPQFWWPSGGLFFLYDAERHVTTTISIKSITLEGTYSYYVSSGLEGLLAVSTWSFWDFSSKKWPSYGNFTS